MAVRKRGRPTEREKALERDRDLTDPKALRPAAWRKTPVRHPEYLNGIIYSYRVCPADSDGVIETVWNARFPDAPGGLQDYEMTTEEFEKAIVCHKEFMERAARISFTDGDWEE